MIAPPMRQEDDDQPAPLGSWRLTYALVCALAVLVITALWFLSAAYDRGRLGS